MKLIRFGDPGQEKPGVLIDGVRYDVSGMFRDYDEEFFASGGLDILREAVRNNKVQGNRVDDAVRLGPPVARPSKLICVGLNFADHARETNAPIPTEPILFFKATSAIVGPNDDLILPSNGHKTDWEVELAVVIGKKASYVSETDAPDYIAGYCLHNDYSERAFQLERGGQWVKGKSADTFAPLGPWLVTPEEAGDISNLRMWLTVNGKTMQNGSTSTMIFGVPFLIHYISQFMTLLPGDIITTGTPPGVGMGIKPEPVYLKQGDVVELGIDGLGSSRQHVRASV